MAREKGGDWDGSTVIDDHLTFLRATCRMPNAAFVKVRVPPREEISPVPQGNKRIVFRSHFLHGFGLPASRFLHTFCQDPDSMPHRSSM